LIVALIVFVAGDFIRYEYYVKQNQAAEKRLKALYTKALGNEQYTDPYGVLLYKVSVGTNSNGLKPIDIVVALSRAKNNAKISINSIDFDGNNLKINGVAKDYSTLASFVGDVNKFLNIQLSIESTKFTSKGLKFILSGGSSI